MQEEWDHPRRCGALSTMSCGSSPRNGSSPQVRGTSGQNPVASYYRGIIPAGAGHFRNMPALS